MARKPRTAKSVETLMHDEAKRKNIPTAEYQSVLKRDDATPHTVKYPRNTDLDPQLVWRGKDEQDWSELVIHAPPLYIQEKVHPKALIDDLLRQTKESQHEMGQTTADLFSDFNGIPTGVDKTEFYQHDQNWSNRMILGDSLQVMASLAEREGLRGKVQCIYLDPPYGIKFNSNFQWSTTSRDVKDGKADHITREPEQVKAFRDTWRDGIHSYLTYLRDRLTVARDLLTDSGSIFVQIGDENVHRVRALMDEIFGPENCVNQITFLKTSSSTSDYLGNVCDYLLWYGKRKESLKFREPFYAKELGTGSFEAYNKVQYPDGTVRSLTELSEDERAKADIIRYDNITSQSIGRDKGEGAASWFPVKIEGREILPSHKVRWKTNQQGMDRLQKAGRLNASKNSLSYVRHLNDFIAASFHHIWTDTVISGSSLDKNYVVETLPLVVQRCLLMATDPSDLVLDPTCGSGTTATVAEQWGRRWITIDTSRVALALARARIMGSRYPFYLLADSREGQLKEAEVTRAAPSSQPVQGNIRHGFVYERVPHIMLKSIANNAEIDVIWDQWQEKLQPLREKLNAALKKTWQERIIQTTAELKKALMHKLFTEGLRNEPQKQTEIGRVPESWEVVPLGKLLTVAQYGMSVKGNPEGNYPILRMTNQVDGQIVGRKLQYVEIGDDEFQKFKVEQGDLLFNRTNSLDLVGRTAIFDIAGEFVFASYLIRLRTDAKSLNSFFLNSYFNTHEVQARLKSIATHAVSQSNISATRLRGFPIPKPSLAEQAEIISQAAVLNRKLAVHRCKIKQLQDLFRSLIHELMTAKIRVHDLELSTGGHAA